MIHSANDNAARFTGWIAIVGGIFAYLNVALALTVAGPDFAITLDGATMLSLPTESRDIFRLSMFADILGFYLPLLAIGGYLWHRFRDNAGALGDMAVLAILVYVVLGVSGAAMQLATLHPLAHLHAGGDDVSRAAAESAWTALAHASQRGLWWSEGPVVLFWGLVVGAQLKRDGWGSSILLPLKIVGWCFGLFFVFGLFPGLNDLTRVLFVLVVLLFPLWMMLFGWQLLRRPTSAAAAA